MLPGKCNPVIKRLAAVSTPPISICAIAVFRQGNYAAGNEGPDHQAAGRLEGSAEGTRKVGEENRTGKVS